MIQNYRYSILFSLKTRKAESASEQATIESLKALFRDSFPTLFQETFKASSQQIVFQDSKRELKMQKDLHEIKSTFEALSCYVSKVLGLWIKETVFEFVAQSQKMDTTNWKKQISSLAPGSSLLNPIQYVAIIDILESLKDFSSIFEVT
jgi:hypothetical protein